MNTVHTSGMHAYCRNRTHIRHASCKHLTYTSGLHAPVYITWCFCEHLTQIRHECMLLWTSCTHQAIVANKNCAISTPTTKNIIREYFNLAKLTQFLLNHFDSETWNRLQIVRDYSDASSRRQLVPYVSTISEHFDKSVNLDSWLTLLSKCSEIVET